jgi:hypothetical protein
MCVYNVSRAFFFLHRQTFLRQFSHFQIKSFNCYNSLHRVFHSYTIFLFLFILRLQSNGSCVVCGLVYFA